MTDFERSHIKNIFRWALPRTRGSKVIQSDTWLQVISEDYRSPSYNEVIRSELTSDSVEEKVEEVLETYRRIGTDFKWCTDAFTQPDSLRDLLRRRGFISWKGREMYASVHALALASDRSALRVQKVERANLELFCELFCRCWNLEAKDHEPVRRQILYSQEQHTAFERFMVFVDDVPAGVASLARGDISGYLFGTAVLPEHQGRGAYKALLQARLEVLKRHGCSLAVTAARESTSAPRLEKLGFKTAWPTEVFFKRIDD